MMSGMLLGRSGVAAGVGVAVGVDVGLGVPLLVAFGVPSVDGVGVDSGFAIVLVSGEISPWISSSSKGGAARKHALTQKSISTAKIRFLTALEPIRVSPFLKGGSELQLKNLHKEMDWCR
jgi:hypothetical protein